MAMLVVFVLRLVFGIVGIALKLCVCIVSIAWCLLAAAGHILVCLAQQLYDKACIAKTNHRMAMMAKKG